MPPPFKLPEKNLVVYGLGGAFHWFHEIFMIRLGYRPDYFIDRHAKDGQRCEGMPVHRDLLTQVATAHRHCYTIVVCAGKKETFDEICKELEQGGFQQIIWIFDLYEIHDPFGLSQDTFAQTTAGQENQILTARSLFQDSLSLEIFDSYIETHRTKTPRIIPQSPPETQYFPLDLDIPFPLLDRIVICGGDHDTLIHLSHKIKTPVESILIFEPDPRGFKKFSDSKSIEKWVGNIEKLTHSLVISPCAISAETGIAPFTSAFTTFGSRLHPEGTILVQRTTLDQSLHGKKPTYICADIEGEEINMVLGAEKIITESKTSLAISVYHVASHIWEIPNLIYKINPGYKFHLRNYTGFCAETILYATPSLPH